MLISRPLTTALFVGGLMTASPALAGDLTLTLEGVQTASGDLFVSVQTRDDFMQPRASHAQIIKLPQAGQRVIVFKDVKPGDYAISVWHDINNDMKFSRAENGMPLDGWAMINGEALRDVPRFDQVKFAMPQGSKQISLKVFYLK